MKQYGLIGEKLGHSFSKEIHEAIADYRYDLIPLSRDAFPAFMEKRDFAAINVTIPYKKEVIPYLDEMDAAARAIGAVNTIVNRGGKLYGYNTDFAGFHYMVKKHGIKMNGKKVVVLGNGGASAAVQAVVRHEQAKACIVVKPTKGNGAISYEECFAKHGDAAVLINTSPVGMYPHNTQSPLDISRFPCCEAVIDVIYNPLVTRFGQQAQEAGIPYVGGLEMLIAQAKYAAEHFLEKEIDDAIIDRLYQAIRRQRGNLVLIGMPSAGKTTIGKRLANRLHKDFIDLDEVVVKQAGMAIPDIFARFKEEGFRDLEEKAALAVSMENGKVIATGGGTIKRKENMDYLRQNGIVVFLDRDVDKLTSSDPNRPLSKSPGALRQLYEQRIELYRTYADHIAANNGDMETTITDIADAYERLSAKA